MSETWPDLFAAVGVHSGLACGAASDMPSAFAAMRQGGSFANDRASNTVPTIVFHGDRDRTVSPVNGDQIIARSQVTSGSKVVELVESGSKSRGTRTVFNDANGRSAAEHWLLHGVAHAWSGGSEAGSYTDPDGLDASREMVRFFLQHRRHD